MKLLIPLIVLASAGSFGLDSQATDSTATACKGGDCRMEVSCTPQGTCEIVCFDASGNEVCRQELPCDAPCTRACDAPAPCATK